MTTPDNAPAIVTALREAEKYKTALKKIALQKLHDEMDEDARVDADWLGGYDECVRQARTALGEP